MIRCISVYPEPISDESINKLEEYLKLAKRYGIQEVFTTIHLPELTLEEQLSFLEVVSNLANSLELELTVDIGGKFIQRVLSEEEILKRIQELKIDFLRMDYGYTFQQLEELYQKLSIKGFVINASMYTENQIEEHIRFLKQLDKAIQIKACHNFYVREESGLDEVFALSQSNLFEKQGIPVYYCVPNQKNPRGPLGLGLPTIESHRWKSLDYIVLDLLYHYHAQAIMLADMWFDEEQLRQIDAMIQRDAVVIQVEFNHDITPQEKAIVLKKHQFRYDSNITFLRSRSSREMAEYASSVPKRNCIQRQRGAITIDNECYERYSGELQVVLCDAKADDRVNVVGWIDLEQLDKLSFYRHGIAYQFAEKSDH